MASLRITQTRSSIGRPKDQRRTLQALGLGRIGDHVTHDDSASIRGMVFKVQHMVEVSSDDREAKTTGAEVRK